MRQSERDSATNSESTNDTMTFSTFDDLNIPKKSNQKRKWSERNDGPVIDDRKNSCGTNEVAKPDYAIGEVVWAKIKGFPNWPAKVVQVYGSMNQMVEVFWFNDYRKTRMHKGQICKFHSNFEVFSPQFDKHIGLQTAIKEALIYLSSYHYGIPL